MTNESDSTGGNGPGRPPPTIELTATEVESPAANTTKAKSESSGPAAAPDTSQAKPAPRGSLHPLAHAISAAVGAIAATLVLLGLWLTGFTLAGDVVNSQTGMSGAGAPNAEIAARLDKIEHAMQEQRSDTIPPAVGGRLTAVEMQTKMLGDSAASLNHKVDDIAATAQAARQQAAGAASAAEAVKNAGQTGVQPSDIEALSKRIAALDTTVKALADQVAHPTTDVDQALRLSVAAFALQAAVERGAPYQAELKAVQALGAAASTTEPLAAFAATGLPHAQPLAHDLAALVPALRQAANPIPADATFLDKLKANAQQLVQITPVDAPSGNDPTAVITRIDIDANRADIAAALHEIASLPDRAKPVVADWAKTAQAREAAITASRSIAADALAALSKPTAQ